MHQLRDGRRGFQASTLSGIPSHTSGRKEAGTARLGDAGAFVSDDMVSRIDLHIENKIAHFLPSLELALAGTLDADKLHTI